MATITTDWTNSWLTTSNLGSDIPSKVNNFSTATQERLQNFGIYCPTGTHGTTDGLLFIGASNFNAGEVNIFGVSGGAPDTTNKLFSMTASACAIKNPTTITGNTTITGDLTVSGAITGSTASTYYIALNTTISPQYDVSAGNFFWPGSNASTGVVSVPHSIANATLVEMRVNLGVQEQLATLTITAGVYNPTFTGDKITSVALSGATQDVSFAASQYGRRITTGFTCPTALTANQQIRFTITPLARQGTPNYVDCCVVLKIN